MYSLVYHLMKKSKGDSQGEGGVCENNPAVSLGELDWQKTCAVVFGRIMALGPLITYRAKLAHKHLNM